MAGLGSDLRSSLFDDVVRNPACVSRATGNQHGREGMQEREPRKVQTGRRRGDASVLDGVTILTYLERKADPAEVRPKAGAPHDISHLDHASVVEHRQATLDAD